jgi:hypothetical protein
MVLRVHQISGKEERQSVELCIKPETGKRWVRVDKALALKELHLFPGAPKTRWFLASSEHPHRATFRVEAKQAEGAGAKDEVREFHLTPDFRMPEALVPTSAVADASTAAGSTHEAVTATAAVAVMRQWNWIGMERLYPYWAVTRMSSTDLRKLQALKATSTLRFNMEVIEVQFANVTVGCPDRNMTFAVIVPVLRNTVALREGEQLCLEVVPKANSHKRKLRIGKRTPRGTSALRPTAATGDRRQLAYASTTSWRSDA